MWVPSDNGVVLQILTVQLGVTYLDVDGSGLAADNTKLAALGIDDAERQQLAKLYAVGTKLWRVPIPHLTPWDCNWPFGLPDDAIAPNGGGAPTSNSAPTGPVSIPGSIIECEGQVLGERIPSGGNPLVAQLQQRTSPRSFRRIQHGRARIRNDSSALVAQDRGIELVGCGTDRSPEFAPQPNLTYYLRWNGRDGYGRKLQGRGRNLAVTIAFVYGAVEGQPGAFSARVAQFPGGLLADQTRTEITIPVTWEIPVGTWDARGVGLGGWTLDAHHTFDFKDPRMYFGDGSRLTGRYVFPAIRLTAGNGQLGTRWRWRRCVDGLTVRSACGCCRRSGQPLHRRGRKSTAS